MIGTELRPVLNTKMAKKILLDTHQSLTKIIDNFVVKIGLNYENTIHR